MQALQHTSTVNCLECKVAPSSSKVSFAMPPLKCCLMPPRDPVHVGEPMVEGHVTCFLDLQPHSSGPKLLSLLCMTCLSCTDLET